MQTGQGQRAIMAGNNIGTWTHLLVVSLSLFTGNFATAAIRELRTQGLDPAHYDIRFVKPLDEKLLHEIFETFEVIITIEDGVIKGGFGSAIIEFASQNECSPKIITLGVPDIFIEQGTVEELQHICKIDIKSLVILFNMI